MLSQIKEEPSSERDEGSSEYAFLTWLLQRNEAEQKDSDAASGLLKEMQTRRGSKHPPLRP